ncbi:MAG: hypothetical protein JO013_04855 [Alphaproteobacteria bacterium]|nr:hypothetical protein [Alphaproteobacteria bacterium]
MALILCEEGDVAAAWAAEQLRHRGVAVDVVTSDALGAATRWVHRVDSRTADVEIDLADGRLIRSAAAVPILNRLSLVPLRALRAAAGQDYGYAVQEMFALYLSWLHAWPAPVINRPAPQGLSGAYRHPSAWRAFAAEAGLAFRPWAQSSADPPALSWTTSEPAAATAFVVAGRAVLPPLLPPTLAEPLIHVAARARLALAGFDFAHDAKQGWAMVGASPLPHLPAGGEAVIGALAEALGA